MPKEFIIHWKKSLNNPRSGVFFRRFLSLLRNFQSVGGVIKWALDFLGIFRQKVILAHWGPIFHSVSSQPRAGKELNRLLFLFYLNIFNNYFQQQLFLMNRDLGPPSLSQSSDYLFFGFWLIFIKKKNVKTSAVIDEVFLPFIWFAYLFFDFSFWIQLWNLSIVITIFCSLPTDTLYLINFKFISKRWRFSSSSYWSSSDLFFRQLWLYLYYI